MLLPTVYWDLHPGNLTKPLKIGNPQRKLIFQPSFFRGYVKFRGCKVFSMKMNEGRNLLERIWKGWSQKTPANCGTLGRTKHKKNTPAKINGLNPKMEICKMIFLFNQFIFWFHVNFQGCMYNPYRDGGFKYFLFSSLFGEDSQFD